MRLRCGWGCLKEPAGGGAVRTARAACPARTACQPASATLTFGAAYLIAAVAVLGLIGLYARAVLGSWCMAAGVTGLLGLFYGYFYVLLQLDAYALLAGSLGLLVTLAAVMYVSRSVDWYGLAPIGAPRRPSEARPQSG